MKKWIYKQFAKLKLAWHYLFHGMKVADDIVVGAKTEHTGDGMSINQVMEADNVFVDLLKGELTERVIETRHSLYAVHQHSINLEKEERRKEKKSINEAFLPRHCMLIEGEYYPVKLIQENHAWSENIDDTETYLLNVERNYTPRLKIEKITNKIVIKEYNENVDEIDFYCRNYVRKFHDKDNFYITELRKIFHGSKKSELLDFQTLSFNTEKPFGMDEGVFVKYTNFTYIECIEFDGHYVLRFLAKQNGEIEKLTDKYKSETMTQKYEQTKEREDAPKYQLTSWDVLEEQQETFANEDEALNLLKNLKSETLSIKKETKNS